MTYPPDLELERLFSGEIEERSDALAKGARALTTGNGSEQLFQDMYREGHTIKGTARMMGFIAVSDAGKLLEDAWKCLRDEEQVPTPALAAALEALSGELLPSVAADPASGTPELAAGMRAVRDALTVDLVPDEVPVTAPTAETGDLGGLLGTLDSGAFGENVRVNADELFRLINEVFGYFFLGKRQPLVIFIPVDGFHFDEIDNTAKVFFCTDCQLQANRCRA